MFLGVHEQYQGEEATTPSKTKERYPWVSITREFKSGVVKPTNLVPTLRNLCQAVWDAGMVCNVSFKLSVAEVLNGEWEIYVKQLCRFLVDNGHVGRTILTFWHEPEDDARDSYPNGTDKTLAFESGEQFVTYFNTIHDWCKSVNSGVITSHAALGYGYRPTVGGDNDKSAYVTDPAKWVTKCDIHAIDLYNGRSFPLDVILPDSPAFKRWVSVRAGLAWSVSERGWTATSDRHSARNEAIRAELAWLNRLPDNEKPVFYIIWLTEGVENDVNLIPDAAMTATINAGFAAIKAPEPTPEPTPVPATRECPLCHGTAVVPADHTIVITTSVTVASAQNG